MTMVNSELKGLRLNEWVRVLVSSLYMLKRESNEDSQRVFFHFRKRQVTRNLENNVPKTPPCIYQSGQNIGINRASCHSDTGKLMNCIYIISNGQ